MARTADIKKGTVVLYYQPGIDGILSAWAGSRVKYARDSGSLKRVTVTAVLRDETGTYYETDADVLLTDADIREVIG